MCPCCTALYYETSFQKAQISINFKGASFSLMENFLKMSRDLSPGVNFTYLFQAELVNSTVESTALEEINKKNHLEMVFDDSDHGLSRSHSVDTSLLLYFFGKYAFDILTLPSQNTENVVNKFVEFGNCRFPNCLAIVKTCCICIFVRRF